MSAPKWTSGPWVVHPSTRYRDDIGQAWDIATGKATWDAHDYDLEEGTRGAWQFPYGYARVATTSDGGPEAKANAQLCAAAPELYAALERCLPLLVQLGDFIGNGPINPSTPNSMGERCDTILLARAALAKARGEG